MVFKGVDRRTIRCEMHEENVVRQVGGQEEREKGTSLVPNEAEGGGGCRT